MTMSPASLAERFIHEHCEAYSEGGQSFLEFRKGHDLEYLDLLGCGVLNLTLPDGERHLLVFGDGSSIFYDLAGASFDVLSRWQMEGKLTHVLEMELAAAGNGES